MVGMIDLVRSGVSGNACEPHRAWQAIPVYFLCRVDPPPVQLMRVDYQNTLLYKEDNSFLLSRHYFGGHRASEDEYTVSIDD